MVLTEDERRFVELTFYRGPSALLDVGFTTEEIREFFDREEVQSALLAIKREYDNEDGLNARSKFMARRALHKMLEPAQAILLQGLAGPEYVRDKKTKNIMRDTRGLPLLVNPEITQSQRWAVDKIFEGAGLHDFRINGDSGIDINVDLLFKKSEAPVTLDTENLGQTEEERVLSRQRVRVAMETLIPRLSEAREVFDAEFTEIVNGGTPTKKKAKKKTAKKRTTKKATKKKATKKKAAKKKASRRTTRSGKAG